MRRISLTERLQKGQTQTVAILKDVDGIAIAKAICAMLNSQIGGSVYIDTSDDGQITKSMPTFKDIRDLELFLKSEITPPSLYSFSIVSDDDKSIIAIDIPPGGERPYVFRGSIYVRRANESEAATANEIREMFSAENPFNRWERQISAGFFAENLDVKAVSQLIDRASKSGRLDKSIVDSEDTFLHHYGYCGVGGYTGAADVLFGRNTVRRHPQVRAQLLVLQQNKVDNIYEDYRWFDGSILETAKGLTEALSAHTRVRAEFRQGMIERIERPAYDISALKEGVVNALVHRDYSSYSGGMKVTVLPDRIEIWNSGSPPSAIKIAALSKSHHSIPVNPDIAHAFYLNGLMERTGRGGQLIAIACKRIGARAPKWKADGSGVTLTIYSSLN